MSIPNNLELTGKLNEFPALELLDQALSVGFNGTFRLEHNPQKIAVYVDQKKVVYAASNLRGHRLAVKLTQWNFVKAEDLVQYQDLPDLELGGRLIAAGIVNAEDLRACQSLLTTEIISIALGWITGEWTFNPLVRVRDELRVEMNFHALQIEAARKLPVEFVINRFGQNSRDSISPIWNPIFSFDLLPEEAFVLSRVETIINHKDLSATIGLPDTKTLPAVYALWLGGMLQRHNYPVAFDSETIEQISAAHLKPSSPATPPATAAATTTTAQVNPKAAANGQAATTNPLREASTSPMTLPVQQATELSEAQQAQALEQYLARVESANTHYQVLDLPVSTTASNIKQAYFKLAKQFHPDKFHSTIGSATHDRLQNAFSKLAHAYEKLKDPKSRELYNFKLQKEGQGEAKLQEQAPQTPEQFFESGVAALNKNDFNEAIVFFNRAVQLAPNVAMYHARLGQALATHQNFRHQAEFEINAAIRLDQANPEWRMLLAEFYLSNKLNKRAEGELNRLLAVHPNHDGARQMLLKLR